MRKYFMFIPILAVVGAIVIALASCESDEIRPMVSISGEFSNTPDPAAGFVSILMPPTPATEVVKPWKGRPILLGEKNHTPTTCETVYFPMKYVVNGSWSFMDKLDAKRSVLTCPAVAFDPNAMGFKGDLCITLSDMEGNQLYLVGEFTSFMDFTNKSFLRCEGGTGKFVNTEGWMTAIGRINPLTGVNALTVFGEMTAPKGFNNPVEIKGDASGYGERDLPIQ